MWIIELAFTSDTARLAARAAHRQRLTDLHRAGVVLMAGPFADDTGAVIVVDVPDRKAVDEMIGSDPYFTAPGVAVRHVRQWQPFLR